jgi:hypothetical protein
MIVMMAGMHGSDPRDQHPAQHPDDERRADSLRQHR